MQGVEGKFHCTSRTFCGKAETPVLLIEAPSELDTGRKMSVKAGCAEAGESTELCDTRHFHRPKTETLTLEMSFDSSDKTIAFFTGKDGREVFHNRWVLMHSWCVTLLTVLLDS